MQTIIKSANGIQPHAPAVKPKSRPELEELRRMTAEQLLDALKASLSLTTEHFERAAMIILVLEEKNVDLREHKLAMFPYIKKIAYGLLAARALAELYAQEYVLRPLSRLPIHDQRRLLDQGVVLGFKDDEGKIVHSKPKPLQSLTRDEVKSVFDDIGAVRTPEQQVAYRRQQEKLAELPEGLPYRYNKSGVHIIRPVLLTKSDWLGIGRSFGWIPAKK